MKPKLIKRGKYKQLYACWKCGMLFKVEANEEVRYVCTYCGEENE